MPRSAHFIIQAAFGASRTVELSKDRLVIGRHSSSDIVIDEPGLPAVMGLVVHSANEYYLVADSEKRPFKVNGEQTGRRILQNGDRLSFDECELIFNFHEYDEVPRESAASSDIHPWSLFSPPSSAQAPSGPSKAASHNTKLPPEPSAAPATEYEEPSIFFYGPALPGSAAPGSLAVHGESIVPPNLLGAASPWHEKTWGKLIAMQGVKTPDIELTASLALLDLGLGKATLSRRHGQCYATLVSGVVFCSKERLGSKPKQLLDNDLIASGAHVYLLRLAQPAEPS